MQALGEIKYFLWRFPRSLSIKVLGREPKRHGFCSPSWLTLFFFFLIIIIISFLNADEYFLIKKQTLPRRIASSQSFGEGLAATGDSRLWGWVLFYFFAVEGSGACRKGPEIKRTHGLHLAGHEAAGSAAQMANPVPSACCVVLAAVVVVYAQRHSQQDSHIQYERVGADVTMKCGSMDWDAAVTWTANGTDIDDSHLNGSYLILKNVDLTQSGQYSCYEGSSWHLKYQTYLRVGTPPKEPVLMCRSNNYPKGFYCSWHLPSPTYIPNSFNISVIHGTREMVCEKDIFPKNRCHIRYLQLFSTVKYKVTLTVTNALGKNSTSLTFDEFAIGNFRGRTWPLRASVGVGLLRAQHLLPERWAREGPGFPGGASACLGVRWSHAGILLVPSLWWFHSAGQPNCATTALSLPFLKGRGGENKMKRAQGLK
uniref:Ig-like domain-containing protein n=1 Tax=Cairina moschata TaxID=8855 RepID=A0A8C3CIX4_CAIMO